MRIIPRILAALLLSLPLLAGCGGEEQDSSREGDAVVDQDATEQAARTEPAEVVEPTEAVETAGEELNWLNYEAGVAKAKAEGRYVLIDFWTAWCHWCKVMDKETYTNAAVLARLEEKFVVVKVNAESKDPQGEAGAMSGEEVARTFGVNSYPTTWFVDSEGGRIAPLAGYMPPSEFLVVLDFVSTGSYESMSFQEYKESLAKG